VRLRGRKGPRAASEREPVRFGGAVRARSRGRGRGCRTRPLQPRLPGCARVGAPPRGARRGARRAGAPTPRCAAPAQPPAARRARRAFCTSVAHVSSPKLSRMNASTLRLIQPIMARDAAGQAGACVARNVARPWQFDRSRAATSAVLPSGRHARARRTRDAGRSTGAAAQRGGVGGHRRKTRGYARARHVITAGRARALAAR
jgi:hypothetical protein